MQNANTEVVKKNKAKKMEVDIVLKNVSGEDMDPKDYFYSDGSKEETERGSFIPSYFNRTCGYPVDREDIIETFNKIFKPEDNCLFYKARDKEVYCVILPLSKSLIGPENNSVSGDHQVHSMSFIAEGSINNEILKSKLQRISQFVKKTNEDE